MTFLPQMIVGPIVLFPDVHDQLRGEDRAGLSLETMQVGLTIFAAGLAKKVFIADHMESRVTPIFAAAEAWTEVYCRI